MDWNITTFLALWGSVLATFTFVWNLSKWLRDRPRLSVNIEHCEGPWGDGISMKIRNRGEKPTTIEQVMLVTYPNWLLSLFGVFPNHVEYTSAKYSDSVKLPFKIHYGETWEGFVQIPDEKHGFMNREHDKLKLIQQGRLYFKIRCAHTDKLISGTVRRESWNMFG
jgi:hypothetical protein